MKEPLFSESGWQRFLNYGHLTGHFAQTLGRGRIYVKFFGQKSILVAVQSGKGHICNTKPFLVKMDCEILGWRFFYAGF